MKEKKNVPSTQSLLSSFDGSRKVYEQGSRPDILVPKREIMLSNTVTQAGDIQNDPIRVYDTSGPYTDENAHIDVTKGLKRLRAAWIKERGDTESYEGRHVKPEDNRISFRRKVNITPSWLDLSSCAAPREKWRQCDTNALCKKRHHHT